MKFYWDKITARSSDLGVVAASGVAAVTATPEPGGGHRK